MGTRTNRRLWREALESTLSWRALDTWIAVLIGAGVYLLDPDKLNASDLNALFLSAGAAGVALSATVFTALAIITALFDRAYREVLDMTVEGEDADGVLNVLAQYFGVFLITTLTSLVGFLLMIFPPEAGTPCARWSVAWVAGFLAWSIVGLISLVQITIFSAVMRAKAQRREDAEPDRIDDSN